MSLILDVLFLIDKSDTLNPQTLTKKQRQTGTIWPGGRKVGREKKLGDLPLVSIPSTVQPPLRLMFDILIFSYQKFNYQTIKEWKHQHQKTKDLQTN